MRSPIVTIHTVSSISPVTARKNKHCLHFFSCARRVKASIRCNVLTKEQLEIRASRCGSNDAPSVCGYNRFRSPMDVWLAKTGRSTFEGNEATDIGNELEESIARMVDKRLGIGPLHKVTKTTVLGPFCATPDFVSDSGEILEIKNVGSTMADDWEGDEPPIYVRAQLQWQMMVCGLSSGFVGALIGGRRVRHFGPYGADTEWQERMITMVTAFWKDHVIPEIPPPFTGSTADDEYLKSEHPRNIHDVRPATDEENVRAAELRVRREVARHHARELHRIESEIKDSIAAHSGIETTSGKLSWIATKDRQSVDWEAAAVRLGKLAGKEAFEAAVADYTFTTPGYRVLRVPRSWGPKK